MKGRISIESEREIENVGFRVTIKNNSDYPVSMSKMDKSISVQRGSTTFDFELDTSMLAPDNYLLSFVLYIDKNKVIDVVRNGFSFNIFPEEGFNDGYKWQKRFFGNVAGFPLKLLK